MTAERAGELCDDLDRTLRGSEMNLAGLANMIVVVLRDEAWRRRRIRTGEIIECASFAELVTAPPLKGFGEDLKKVEALLKDDLEALRMFRAEVVAPQGQHHHTNVIKKAIQGNTRSYTLARLHKKDEALYRRVVAGELSVNAAAIKAGLRPRTVTVPVDDLDALAGTLHRLLGKRWQTFTTVVRSFKS